MEKTSVTKMPLESARVEEMNVLLSAREKDSLEVNLRTKASAKTTVARGGFS